MGIQTENLQWKNVVMIPNSFVRRKRAAKFLVILPMVYLGIPRFPSANTMVNSPPITIIPPRVGP